MVLAHHGDKKLKSMMVKEMEFHRKQDSLVRGEYGHMNGKFRGCAVGCGVRSLNVKLGKTISYNDHASYAKELGIPEWLARVEDSIFEGLPEDEAKLFPTAFLKAIPVGVDLEPVKHKFAIFILKENVERVEALKIDAGLKTEALDAINVILSLHRKAVETGAWDESAAWSAAWSAESAAWSAESAAFTRYRDELLRLLIEAGKS